MSIQRILHVEDNKGDANLLREAVAEMSHGISIDYMSNGKLAIEWLHLRHETAALLPELIVTDINMPQMNGFAFLRLIRSHHLWDGIPVLMLTSSNRASDRENARILGAAGYLLKPSEYEGYVDLARCLLRFPDMDSPSAEAGAMTGSGTP